MNYIEGRNVCFNCLWLSERSLLYNLQNPRLATRQPSGLNFFLQNNNNFIYVLQPHIFRAEIVFPKQHLSFNVCCFCQGSLLGRCTASPRALYSEPFTRSTFLSVLLTDGLPTRSASSQRSHFFWRRRVPHKSLLFHLSALCFLACWVHGWLVGWLLGTLVVWITATYSSSSTLQLEAGGYSETWLTIVEHVAHPKRVGFISNAVKPEITKRSFLAPV